MCFFLSNWHAVQIVVIYPGQGIKTDLPKKFLTHPLHPYVHQLLNSVPSYDRRSELWSVIPDKVPNFYQLPTWCRFHPRCSFAFDKCQKHV